MASVDLLARLFQALAAGDMRAAEEAAAQIVAAEERIGHHTAAQMLRGSLRPNLTKSGGGNGSSLFATAEVVGHALTPLVRDVVLKDVQLRPRSRAEIKEICDEWSHRAALQAALLPRRSRLFFYGPPGCGKSITAAALAREMSLPIFVVRFDGVVGAYLGQTAVHLRQLFHFAETTACILLIDEVDALGKHRGNPLDVGELDRIVITLMQEFEHSQPAGFVIATSNLPQQLDTALWRRFDLALEFPRPSHRELQSFVTRRAKELGLGPRGEWKRPTAEVASFADAEKALLSEARRAVLDRERQR